MGKQKEGFFVKRTCGLLFLCAALTASLTACGNHTVRRDNDGTMTGSPGNGTASYDSSEPYNNGSVTDHDRDTAWNAGDMLDDAGDNVRDAMDDAGDRVRNAMDDAAGTARDSVHNAQDAADQIEERAREALYGTGSVPNDQNG